MKIAVLTKEVIDLVEELEIQEDGSDIDREYMAYRSNEFDDYALEEALQMRQEGDTIDVYALDGDEADNILNMAAARGANNLFKVMNETLNPEEGISSRNVAKAFYEAIKSTNYDLVLTGVQGLDDLDGQIHGHVSQMMGAPLITVVVKIEHSEDKITCMKEFPGGVLAEYEVELPAVIGVQASRSPPAYIPVSKIRRVAQETTINEVQVTLDDQPLAKLNNASLPETGKGAEMITGEVEAQVSKLMEILESKGIVS